MIGAGESYTSEFAEEDVGDGREPELELVGAEHVRTGTISEEEELLFLDAVLHISVAISSNATRELKPYPIHALPRPSHPPEARKDPAEQQAEERDHDHVDVRDP
jgi:hypothetical protein